MDIKRQMKAGHSPNIERYTPAYIFEGLNTRFDLDPCAPPPGVDCSSKCYCQYFLHKHDDGLAAKWFGNVWLNPPWHRNEAPKWIYKLKQHGDGIALMHGNFASQWFQQNSPDGLFLLAKRIAYENVKKKVTAQLKGETYQCL